MDLFCDVRALLGDALARPKKWKGMEVSAPFALYFYYINFDGGDRTSSRCLFSLCLLWVTTKSGKRGLDKSWGGVEVPETMHWSIEGARTAFAHLSR